MAETERRETSEFVEVPLKYLADAEDIPVYIDSVGSGDTSRASAFRYRRGPRGRLRPAR
jgi:hypothetical protein